MSLLDFARGPGLYWSLIIFSAGIFLRLLGIWMLRRHTDLSKPRAENTTSGGFRAIGARMWPKKEFRGQNTLHVIMGYVFHIGFLLVIIAFVPHILFIEGLTGLSWSGLPNQSVVLIGAITLAAMLYLLTRRMTHPVLKIISGLEDYLSWLVTALPLITGLMLYARPGLSYDTLVGLHLLSFELLLVWFPFSKLMHAITLFPSRFQLGAHMARRGVKP